MISCVEEINRFLYQMTRIQTTRAETYWQRHKHHAGLEKCLTSRHACHLILPNKTRLLMGRSSELGHMTRCREVAKLGTISLQEILLHLCANDANGCGCPWTLSAEPILSRTISRCYNPAIHQTLTVPFQKKHLSGDRNQIPFICRMQAIYSP